MNAAGAVGAVPRGPQIWRGAVIAGPIYDKEAIVSAECDLREALYAKRYFDVAGHYARTEVPGPDRMP